MLKMFTAFGLVLFSMTANAGNFSVSDQPDGSKMIICEMDKASRVAAFQAMGIRYGASYPAGPILKDAAAGTKVLVDDSEVTVALPALSRNGYQTFVVPQDEYRMTLVPPEGAQVSFEILVYRQTPCVLNLDEIKAALLN